MLAESRERVLTLEARLKHEMQQNEAVSVTHTPPTFFIFFCIFAFFCISSFCCLNFEVDDEKKVGV